MTGIREIINPTYVLHETGDLLFHNMMFVMLLAQLVYAVVCAVKYRRTGARFYTRKLG